MTTVALVDDHEMLRSGLAGLINTFPDFKVIFEAGNGKEFIQKLDRNNPPDIVLLDITMPLMDGYETALWIKTEIPIIKVLVLSMLSNDMAIIRMLRNGVKGYILKESKPAILKQAMEAIKNNEFYVNELVRDKLVNYITNEEIAKEMFISVRTIDSHRDNLFRKLEINTRVGLVVFAIKHGITTV
jgi:DNA-binding NarL/FixJ family response regulator